METPQVWIFRSLREGFVPVESKSLKDAFKVMYEFIVKALDEGGMTHMELETAIWIETPALPLFFYEVRDMAISFGWLVDGKLTY